MSSCRLCGSKNLKLYYTQGNRREFKFYKCHKCGLVNYELVTRLDQVKYATDFGDPLDSQSKYNKTQNQTYQFIKQQFPAPGILLDVGCGNGRLLYLARRDGWQVKGLELSPLLVESIQQKLGIEVGLANFLEYQGQDAGQYDLVVLRHVLEHLPDSVLALTKIHYLLNQNGFAVLEFPNIEALELKLKRRMQKMGLYHKQYKENYIPGHCNEFSKKSFSYLASLTGFEIKIWQTYSNKKWINLFQARIPIGNKCRVLIRKKKEE